MNDFKNSDQERKSLKMSAEEVEKRHRRRWKRRMKVRAARMKKQLNIENKFHHAMQEMQTTTDHYRRSYLHWILNHMFSLFDYETGLHAINDKSAYRTWLSENMPGSRGKS